MRIIELFPWKKTVPPNVCFLNHMAAVGLSSLTSLVDLVAQGETGTLVRIIRDKLDVDDGTRGNYGRRCDVTAVPSQQVRRLRIPISNLYEVIPKNKKQYMLKCYFRICLYGIHAKCQILQKGYYSFKYEIFFLNY